MKKLATDELNRISIEEFKEADKFPIVIVLDNIRSMNNVGSFFRTSDAFRLEKIYLCGYTPCPPHRDITKSAIGAELSVHWEHAPDTLTALTQLKNEGYHLLAIEQAEESVSLENFIPNNNEKYALIFGNEVEGVADEVMNQVDLALEIPQFGTKHSLNVSVAAGIVVWHLIEKLIIKK